jgi:phosphatidate cytidylyltransferase
VPELSVGATILLGAGLAVFGLLGDLSASVLKRSAGLKDFGHVIPGHGGVLDRLDSLILTGPLAFAVFRLVG